MNFVTDSYVAYMTKSMSGLRRPQIYSWNEKFADCLRTRKLLQQAREHPSNGALKEHKSAHRALNRAIRMRKEQGWMSLNIEVDDGPWGKPYKVAMSKIPHAMLY